MRVVLAAVGLVLVLGTLFGGNLKYITDWSSAQLIGYNAWSLVAIFGGGYLTYWGLKGKKKQGTTKDANPT